LKNEIAAVVLVVAIIVSAGAGYLVGVANQHAATSVSTTTLTKEATTATSTVQGLQLLASVRPSSLAVGQNVTIVAEVYNSLQTNVTINAGEITNPSQEPCGLGVVPTGIRVYSGHYTFTNLSAASPLLLYNDSLAVPCFVVFNNTYTFQPNSDNATVSSLGASIKWVANETISLSGYWTTGLVAGPSSKLFSQNFEPGPYTVLVFDAWGQQLIEYFEVT